MLSLHEGDVLAEGELARIIADRRLTCIRGRRASCETYTRSEAPCEAARILARYHWAVARACTKVIALLFRVRRQMWAIALVKVVIRQLGSGRG